MKYVLRTRFGNIVSEYLPPAQASRKVMILCAGMPSYPGKRDTMMSLAQKGYWVFAPRYRGTWESGGSFLRASPHEDVLDVINGISRGFNDAWSGKRMTVRHPEIYLVGSSFGGPAVLLASKNNYVRKVIALAPVVDWRVRSKSEPLGWLETFVRRAFGEAYHFTHKDWQKLGRGVFYNPAMNIRMCDRGKVMVIHAKNDTTVPFTTTEALSARWDVNFWL